MSADLNQLMDKLKGDTPKGQVVVETGKLVSKKKIIRGKNGGVRPNSGRPPKAETLIKLGVKAWIDEHANEKTANI